MSALPFPVFGPVEVDWRRRWSEACRFVIGCCCPSSDGTPCPSLGGRVRVCRPSGANLYVSMSFLCVELQMTESAACPPGAPPATPWLLEYAGGSWAETTYRRSGRPDGVVVEAVVGGNVLAGSPLEQATLLSLRIQKGSKIVSLAWNESEGLWKVRGETTCGAACGPNVPRAYTGYSAILFPQSDLAARTAWIEIAGIQGVNPPLFCPPHYTVGTDCLDGPWCGEWGQIDGFSLGAADVWSFQAIDGMIYSLHGSTATSRGTTFSRTCWVECDDDDCEITCPDGMTYNSRLFTTRIGYSFDIAGYLFGACLNGIAACATGSSDAGRCRHNLSSADARIHVFAAGGSTGTAVFELSYRCHGAYSQQFPAFRFAADTDRLVASSRVNAECSSCGATGTLTIA